jgi:hypothetical protein
MATYEVKIIVNGHTTKSTVEASSEGAAKDIVKSQYHGDDVRICSVKRN